MSCEPKNVLHTGVNITYCPVLLATKFYSFAIKNAERWSLTLEIFICILFPSIWLDMELVAPIWISFLTVTTEIANVMVCGSAVFPPAELVRMAP